MTEYKFFNSRVVNNLAALRAKAEITPANRFADKVYDVVDKVFTRHLFGAN